MPRRLIWKFHARPNLHICSVQSRVAYLIGGGGAFCDAYTRSHNFRSKCILSLEKVAGKKHKHVGETTRETIMYKCRHGGRTKNQVFVRLALVVLGANKGDQSFPIAILCSFTNQRRRR
jgi:hypothetical protein